MFQFRRFPSLSYLIQIRIHGLFPCEFPHSEICGSKVICTSPQLIAAYRVLHRLLMPRHPSCALSSLTYFLTITSSLSNVQIIVATSTDLQNCLSVSTLFTLCFPEKPSNLNYLKKFSYLLLSFFECLLSIQFSMCWLVEISGIEPLASCLQGRRSPS